MEEKEEVVLVGPGGGILGIFVSLTALLQLLAQGFLNVTVEDGL